MAEIVKKQVDQSMIKITRDLYNSLFHQQYKGFITFRCLLNILVAKGFTFHLLSCVITYGDLKWSYCLASEMLSLTHFLSERSLMTFSSLKVAAILESLTKVPFWALRCWFLILLFYIIRSFDLMVFVTCIMPLFLFTWYTHSRFLILNRFTATNITLFLVVTMSFFWGCRYMVIDVPLCNLWVLQLFLVAFVCQAKLWAHCSILVMTMYVFEAVDNTW